MHCSIRHLLVRYLSKRYLVWPAVCFCLTFDLFAEELPHSVLKIPVAIQGEHCVEPLEIMRTDHMNLLFHQRDKTMYDGVRDSKHSLIGCLSCHTQKDDAGDYIPINAEGQFCQICHDYAAVKIDCFECHATTPGAQVVVGD